MNDAKSCSLSQVDRKILLKTRQAMKTLPDDAAENFGTYRKAEIQSIWFCYKGVVNLLSRKPGPSE